MPITMDEIVEQTRTWPDEQVADLMDRILLARHDGASDLSPAWKQEIDRRISELEKGTVKGVPWEEVRVKAKSVDFY